MRSVLLAAVLVVGLASPALAGHPISFSVNQTSPIHAVRGVGWSITPKAEDVVSYRYVKTGDVQSFTIDFWKLTDKAIKLEKSLGPIALGGNAATAPQVREKVGKQALKLAAKRRLMRASLSDWTNGMRIGDFAIHWYGREVTSQATTVADAAKNRVSIRLPKELTGCKPTGWEVQVPKVAMYEGARHAVLFFQHTCTDWEPEVAGAAGGQASVVIEPVFVPLRLPR